MQIKSQYSKDLIRKTIELRETKAQLEDKYYELQALNKEINKQNRDLIRRTIELTETKARLEDKNIDLIGSNKEIERQKKELIRATIDLSEFKSQLEEKNLELVEANKEILAMLKMKTEFINQAAHDLRTPLTPILTLTPLLKNYLHNDESLHNLKVIENNANYLAHIVNELLSYVKAQTGRFEYVFKNEDITKLIDEVLSNNEVVFNEHDIKLIKKYEKGMPKVKLDRFKFIELLQNILSNAVKFTPGKGVITITVQKIDNFINVNIKDTGIGMSKYALKRVFEEFFREDVSRHGEGVGLGLSICKRIIERHNGMIGIESQGHGKGTTVIFEIPIGVK